MSFFTESPLVSAFGRKILNLFEHNFESCAQTLASQHYLGGHFRSEEGAPRRIFFSLALWTRQLFEGVGNPLEPQECTLMKELRRSRSLSPHQPKNVTFGLWRHMWPQQGYFYGKPHLQQTAKLKKLQLA